MPTHAGTQDMVIDLQMLVDTEAYQALGRTCEEVDYSANLSNSGQFAARSIKRVSTTPSSCTTTRRSDIAPARRSSHRATTYLSPRSAIRWSAVAAK